MKARDLMTSDPFTITLTDTVARAAEVMRDLQIGCVPIVAEDTAAPALMGLITDRDIAIRCVSKRQAPSGPVRDYMTATPLQTVGPDADVTEVVRKMEEAQVRRIPVVNADGVLLGIIAQADLATKLGPWDPRLVEQVLQRISTPIPAAV